MKSCQPTDGVIVIEYSRTSPLSASVAEAWNSDVDAAVFSATVTDAPLTFVKTGALLISKEELQTVSVI